MRPAPDRIVPRWVRHAEFGGLGIRTDFGLPIRERWRERQVAPIAAFVGPSAEADELGAARLGVEVRLPFLPMSILRSSSWACPPEVKYPDHSNVTKRLLRDTMRGRLPDELLDRPGKTYFDEHIADTADWAACAGWFTGSEFRVPGASTTSASLSDIDRRELNAERHRLGV